MKTAKIIWSAFWNLSAILGLIRQILDAFNLEKLPVAIMALKELIAKISPPAPTADSAGNKPANPDGEKRKRWRRFLNRIKVAEAITDAEAHEFCTQHHINDYEIA